MREGYDTIIVGGGLSGLAAGVLLAQGGQRVLLLERSGELGGRARTERVQGYAFNLGAHALYREGALARGLRRLGLEVPGHFVGAAGAFADHGGRLYTLPAGPFSLLLTRLLPAHAKLEVARVLARLGQEEARVPPEEDAASWIQRSTRTPEARAFLAAFLRVSTYGSSPRLTSARAAVRQARLAATSGVEYVDGGWAALVEALAARLQGAGGQVRVRAAARAVEPGGVLLDDGAMLSARSVIVALPPREAAPLFRGPTAERLARFAEQARPVLAACLDLALSALPRPAHSFALGIDRPTYVSVHSRVARLAPPGGALLHALCYLDPDREVEEVRLMLQEAVERLQPGYRRLIVHERFLPHMMVCPATIPPAGRGPARLEPTTPVEEGVFLAGDAVGDGWMLADAAFASAEAAAELAAARGGRAVAA